MIWLIQKFTNICMYKESYRWLMAALLVFAGCTLEEEIVTSGNPLFPGWYADPASIIVDDTYWIFPTWSDHYGELRYSNLTDYQIKLRENAINQQYLKQTFLDAFSSKDLVSWEKHEKVLDVEHVEWAAYSIWAPAITEKEGKFYLFFGANDIQSDDEPGGIGVAVADSPEGPFRDYLGKPLINKFHHGAQPIDQYVFKDVDGLYYLIYGGWSNCNIGMLNDDFTGFTPFEDGSIFKSITPEGYVEGPFMFVRKGKYYFMWSEGGWMGPNYRVAYAIGDSPTGPFERIGTILQENPEIARGTGHHSVINIPGTDDWYIIYHRRPADTENPHHRNVNIEYLYFDDDGYIKPVVITREGVKKRTLD